MKESFFLEVFDTKGNIIYIPLKNIKNIYIKKFDKSNSFIINIKEKNSNYKIKYDIKKHKVWFNMTIRNIRLLRYNLMV